MAAWGYKFYLRVLKVTLTSERCGHHGRSQDFSKGGHTVSNRGYSRFRNLDIVGCLSKKRLTKGESRAPVEMQQEPLLTMSALK